MLEEKELRTRIQEEFSNTKPYKGDYWNSVRCIAINNDDVNVRYVFFRHCEEYDKEYWIMKPLYETKYVIFEDTKTGERLFGKVEYEESQSAFFFSGLEESDIDTIVALYKDLKSIAPVQELPHNWRKEERLSTTVLSSKLYTPFMGFPSESVSALG